MEMQVQENGGWIMLPIDDYNEEGVISPELFFAQTGKLSKETAHVKKYILTFPYMKILAEKAKAFNLRDIQWYKNFGLFNVNGEDVGLMISSPGAPMMVTILEELIALGGRYFILVGGVGVLLDEIERGDIIIPDGSVSDEGTSQHYLPKESPANPSSLITNKLIDECAKQGITFFKGNVWTTDAPYRETPSRIKYAKENGAVCVDMEASACFAVAQFRNVDLSAIFYGGDLVNEKGWDFRGSDLEKPNKVEEKLFEIACNVLTGLE